MERSEPAPCSVPCRSLKILLLASADKQQNLLLPYFSHVMLTPVSNSCFLKEKLYAVCKKIYHLGSLVKSNVDILQEHLQGMAGHSIPPAIQVNKDKSHPLGCKLLHWHRNTSGYSSDPKFHLNMEWSSRPPAILKEHGKAALCATFPPLALLGKGVWSKRKAPIL